MKNEPNIIPTFATETEEADWAFEHQDVILDEFKRAAAEGRLNRGTAMRRAQEAQLAEAPMSSTVIVQLEPADEAKARAVAAKRGMEYEVFLGLILHKELQKPEEALESASAA